MKYTKIAQIAAVTALSLGLLSPAFAFAKKEGNQGKNIKAATTTARFEGELRATTTKATTTTEREQKPEKAEKKGFFARFREMFSFGAGKSGKTPSGLEHAPGIWKKIGSQGTSTPGALNISGITVSQVSMNGARISWKTSGETSTKLMYGTDSSFASSSSALLSSNSFTVVHNVTMSGLSALTTYYFKIASTLRSGKTVTSGTLSFTTAGTGKVTDTAAPVMSGIMATSTATGLHIIWTTNEPSTSKVTYATVSPIGTATTTSHSDSSALVSSHDVALSALSASTTYFYTVSSADTAGNTAVSGEYNFILQ